MKKYFHNIIWLTLSAALLAGSWSCKPKEDPKEDLKAYQDIVSGYTDNTVIATYGFLADKAIELSELCQALRQNPTQDAVAAAAEKWRQARVFWEQSEAFLFGPANYNNLDPKIDSWPLDKNELDVTLNQPNILDIDATKARARLGNSLIGFHAIEYVLFRDGAARPLNDISNEELAYLAAIAQVLAEDCILLEASWAGMDAVSEIKKQMLSDAEIGISTDFGKEMKNAGKAGSRFPSIQSAISEIIEGCKDIADEVGNAKIADPVESKNVLEVESWYSWNSITDFTDNIRSIENAYLGGVPNKRGYSLSSYVAEKNKALDDEIKSRIATAIAKIRAIGEPFRNHLDNEQGAQEAIEACDDLFNSLHKIYTYIE
jgi:predicted lipoprotein